ncbi:MAG: peptidylprolyl isomerase [Chloroflexota bacterium]|jgi:cyclophilin family peptidyl-prolyl cis-trans isomerase
MAKKRQSSQSVRQSAKRRAEEARKRRNEQIRLAALIVVAVVVLAGAVFLVQNLTSEEPAAVAAEVDFGEPGPLAAMVPAERANYYDQPPEMVIDPSKEYEAVIRTDKGDLRLRLFAAESPLAVNNFVFLARQGFYDSTVFHRVIADFMAQGGDPTGTGTGGPGYAFADEVDNGLTFDRPGLLAMANSGANTNGSQFFITYAPTPWLDGAHTIFGELIDGQDVLDSLTLVDPQNPSGLTGDTIERIAIIES